MQDRKYSVGVGNRGLMILKRCSEKALRRRYDMREEAKEEGRLSDDNVSLAWAGYFAEQ